MIGLKSPTIIDVENGKEISYSKLLEGKTVEDSSTYHPTSGLWECKNGEVINVAESIRQGKRVVAEPRHYHNNKGMCPTSGKVMDTETGTEIDLIDSILANGSGGGIGMKYMTSSITPSMVKSHSSNVSKLTFSNNGNLGIGTLFFTVTKEFPIFTSEILLIEFNDSLKGFICNDSNGNDFFNHNEHRTLLGIKEEWYYYISRTLDYNNDRIYFDLFRFKIVDNKQIFEKVKTLFESKNLLNYIIKNDEKECYEFYIVEDGYLKPMATIGYLEYSDRPIFGVFTDIRVLDDSSAKVHFLDYRLSLIDFKGVRELLSKPTTLELEKDYELMDDEHKPTLWNRTKSKIKSLFNFK